MHTLRVMRALALAIAGAVLSGTVVASEEAEPLVLARAGGLPVLITVLHGGREEIPDVAPRQRGVTTRDGGTLEIAQALADRLERELGARPYLAGARFHRRFADANRAESEAIESPAARRPYEHYHQRIREFVDQIRARFPNGALLVDLHGQSEDPTVVHRGTQNGATVNALLRRRRPAALIGPNSLSGRCSAPAAASFRSPAHGSAGLARTHVGPVATPCRLTAVAAAAASMRSRSRWAATCAAIQRSPPGSRRPWRASIAPTWGHCPRA